MINIIDKKLLEVEQDENNGAEWLTKEDADKLILINNEMYV